MKSFVQFCFFHGISWLFCFLSWQPMFVTVKDKPIYEIEWYVAVLGILGGIFNLGVMLFSPAAVIVTGCWVILQAKKIYYSDLKSTK